MKLQPFEEPPKPRPKGLKPSAQAILRALQGGSLRVTQLWQIAGPGFSTRISEIRAWGRAADGPFDVVYDRERKVYRLEAL